MGVRPSQVQVVYDEVFGQLRLARTEIDRLRVQRAELLEQLRVAAEENEALRELAAVLAASVGGAVL